MRKSLGEAAKDCTDEKIYGEFRGEIARTISYESGVTENLHEIREQGKKKERKKACRYDAFVRLDIIRMV